MCHCIGKCPYADNSFENGFRSGLEAAIHFINNLDEVLVCPPCRHPGGRYKSGGYCYCEQYPNEELTRKNLVDGIRQIEVPGG